jgi:DNA-binding NtrC family response regulator
MTLPGPSHRARRRAPDRGLRILVVDEEEPMRRTVARLLERAGYGVVTSTGADGALALLGADGGFALVVTGAGIQGSMDGLGLARWLADHRPDLAVIVLADKADGFEAARAIPSVAGIVARREATRALLGPVRAALGA